MELNQSVRDNTSFEKYRSLGYDHEKLFMSYKDYLNEGQKEKGSEFVAETITDNGTKAKTFFKMAYRCYEVIYGYGSWIFFCN